MSAAEVFLQRLRELDRIVVSLHVRKQPIEILVPDNLGYSGVNSTPPRVGSAPPPADNSVENGANEISSASTEPNDNAHPGKNVGTTTSPSFGGAKNGETASATVHVNPPSLDQVNLATVSLSIFRNPFRWLRKKLFS